MGYFDDWVPADWKTNWTAEHSICWIVVASQPNLNDEYPDLVAIIWKNIAACTGLLLFYTLCCLFLCTPALSKIKQVSCHKLSFISVCILHKKTSPEGQVDDPSSGGGKLFSFLPASNFLVSVSDPFRAF